MVDREASDVAGTPPEPGRRRRRPTGALTAARQHPARAIGAGLATVLVAGTVALALASGPSSEERVCAQLREIGETCRSSSASLDDATTTTDTPDEDTDDTAQPDVTADDAQRFDHGKDTTTTTRETAAGMDVVDLLGLSMDSQEVSAVLDTYGCRISRSFYVPGGLIPSSEGYECRPAGIGLSIDTGLHVSGIGFRDGGVHGYDRYPGTLPYDLHWGDSRVDVESRFDDLLGPPVTRGAPTGYSWDTDPRFWDSYKVTGKPFASLQLEFAPDTEGLREVIIGVDPPWCISSCYDPNSPPTTVSSDCFVDCEDQDG